MKAIQRIVSLLTLLALLLGCVSGCGGSNAPEESETPAVTEQEQTGEQPIEVEHKDYVAALKFNPVSQTAKQEVTVKAFIDGDTVHFNVPSSVNESGVLKARFLAVNTPESTGKIEEYGKKASAFTREKLTGATSIIIESEDNIWNPDSTGDRYLVWVWYRTSDTEEYRCLNMEILQNGLAIANSTANNRYGDLCMAALNQAKAEKLNVYSGEKDPDFYYGDAIELTLLELRSNIESYNGMKVAFNGVVTMNASNTVYVESYDAETDLYCGISVYYGYGLSGAGLDILSVGNEVRIVGTVQYYELGGTYQISDVSYRAMKPDDPNNLQKISEGHSAAYRLTDAATFAGDVTFSTEEGDMTLPYAQLALGSTLTMQGLTVVDAYTTDNEDSSSKGAMTLTCEADGVQVSVRTVVLRDGEGNVITADAYLGKTIDVMGVVDFYDGNYQIKVFSADKITVHE